MTDFLKASVLPGVAVPDHKHHRMLVILIVLLIVAIVIGVVVYFGYKKEEIDFKYTPVDQSDVLNKRLEEASNYSIKLSEQEKLKRITAVEKSTVPITEEEKLKRLEAVNNFNTNK